MTTEAHNDSNWSERDWDILFEHIRDGTVIPVVGEELYTVTGADGAEQPLNHVMAEKLAAQMKLEMPPGWEQGRPLNEVVCAYVRDEMQRSRNKPEMPRIYNRFCDLYKTLSPQPPAALLQLAEIRDFKLLVTTTPDDLLERALDQVRFRGSQRTSSLAFKPKAPYEDLPDLYNPSKIKPTEPPMVYHLFGRLVKQLADQFVLSDDDLLEFFRAIQKLHDVQARYLRAALEENHLLFLGGSLSDWLVRFLLRAANGDRRLSDRSQYDVLATSDQTHESDLVKFLKFFSPGTKLAPFGPREFVAEMNRRWKEANPLPPGGDPDLPPPPKPLPDTMPAGSVFISYASEDRELVYKIKAYLDEADINVWFDREQLMSGHNWDMEIEKNIKKCSFFIPIISQTTQKYLLDVYFRKEWYLADQMAISSYAGTEFILPMLLEKIPKEDLAVPQSFLRHQGEVAPAGVPPKEFVKRLKDLVEQRKANPLRRQP
jgi:hypothetical protein